MPIQKQFVVFLRSTQGALSKLTQDLSRERLNLLAIFGPDTSGYGIIRFLVDEPARARRVLERKKYAYKTEDVVTLTIGNKPGSLAGYTKSLSASGININYIYGSSTDPKGKALLVFGVDDPKLANQILR